MFRRAVVVVCALAIRRAQSAQAEPGKRLPARVNSPKPSPRPAPLHDEQRWRRRLRRLRPLEPALNSISSRQRRDDGTVHSSSPVFRLLIRKSTPRRAGPIPPPRLGQLFELRDPGLRDCPPVEPRPAPERLAANRRTAGDRRDVVPRTCGLPLRRWRRPLGGEAAARGRTPGYSPGPATTLKVRGAMASGCASSP